MRRNVVVWACCGVLAACSLHAPVNGGHAARQEQKGKGGASLERMAMAPTAAERAQQGIEHPTRGDVRRRLDEVRRMMEERFAFDRKPIAPRVEGRSAMRGKCERVTISAVNLPLSILLQNVIGKRVLRRVDEGGEPDMAQPVTVHAKGECLDVLLDRVLTGLDVAYQLEPHALTVMARETRAYQAPPLRVRQRYSSGTVSAGINAGGQNAGGGAQAGGGGAGGAGASGGQVENEAAKLDELRDLVGSVKALLGEGSTVSVNRATGELIVHARPSEHRRVGRFLAEYARQYQRAVMVTARVIEVNEDDLREHGMSLDLLLSRVKGGAQVITGFGQQVQGTSGSVRVFNTQGSFLFDLLGVLRENKIRFVQRVAPSVTVLNRKGATINLGQQEQYVKSITITATQATASAAAQLVPAPELGVLQTGVQLDVWPSVDDRGVITAQVRVAITDKVAEKTFTFQNVGSFNSPVLSTREINTQILTRDGGTVVISGLSREYRGGSGSGIPGLMDAPVVGGVFGYKKRQRTRTQALVFLTMRSVRSGIAPSASRPVARAGR